jgi:hypothetical protein
LSMITTRIMELRKRRGLMIALVVVTIGIPTLFLVIRLLAHAFAPKSYGPAGGYEIYTSLVAGVMYVFGFIVAATLGCTDVPPFGGDGPVAVVALSGPHPGRVGHRRAVGGHRLHHRLHRVCVRRSDPTQLRRCHRARPPVARRFRELGGRPRRRGRLRPPLSDRTVVLDRSRGPGRPVRSQRPRSAPRPDRSPGWTMPTTAGSSCIRRTR